MPDLPRIVYLDQNKWIDIARCIDNPARYSAERAVLDLLVREARAGRLLVPLTFTNIYETHKINDSARRDKLARVLVTLSQGTVFRGRAAMLNVQVSQYLRRVANSEPLDLRPFWFLSDIWLESVVDYDPAVLGFDLSEEALSSMRANPQLALYTFIMRAAPQHRSAATAKFSEGSNELICRIEERRARVQGEPLAMRRRLYSAEVIIGDMDAILGVGRELGLPWSTPHDIGRTLVRSFAVEIPMIHTEVELAVRIEDQKRDIKENDLRDVATFCRVLPYADIMIAEKAFTNVARQAGLGKKYGTVLRTGLSDIRPEMLA